MKIKSVITDIDTPVMSEPEVIDNGWRYEYDESDNLVSSSFDPEKVKMSTPKPICYYKKITHDFGLQNPRFLVVQTLMDNGPCQVDIEFYTNHIVLSSVIVLKNLAVNMISTE